MRMTEAQRRALEWLPAEVGVVRYNTGDVPGSALAALERRGLAQRHWDAFPNLNHPWSITPAGRRALEERKP